MLVKFIFVQNLGSEYHLIYLNCGFRVSEHLYSFFFWLCPWRVKFLGPGTELTPKQ